MNVNDQYKSLLWTIVTTGELCNTRNSETLSHISLPRITFTEAPLVTVRKTAWRKAIREMEWFLSGEQECPLELREWWKGQLNPKGCLIDAYPDQLRYFVSGDDGVVDFYDQVAFVHKALKTNPNSRRILMTCWHPKDMENITESNRNPNTPTCCHTICVQFFVRNGALHMTSYQRSADMLLGVPHNWIQSWAMLLYFAYHAGLEVGSMTWDFGDAHIYNNPSHIQCVEEILCAKMYKAISYSAPKLIYNPTDLKYDRVGVPIFNTEHFVLEGSIPEPVTTIKPELL